MYAAVVYLVEQLVAEPGEQVVQDVVPAVGVELKQVLDDADLDLSTSRRRVLMQHCVRLHFFFAVNTDAGSSTTSSSTVYRQKQKCRPAPSQKRAEFN